LAVWRVRHKSANYVFTVRLTGLGAIIVACYVEVGMR